MDPRYRVNLGTSSPTVPWLLESFATWLSTQAYGAIGCFTLEVRADEKVMIFATLPNDQQLAIDAATSAVVLRWANGAKREIAKSLAAFLLALSESNTGIIALDVGNSGTRGELAAWLRLSAPGPRPPTPKMKRDTEPVQTAR